MISIKKNKVVSLFFRVLMILFFASSLFAAEPKKIRVACDINDALYFDENGDPTGICFLYIQQIAWNNNWILEFVPGSYNESLQKLLKNEIDIMLPIGNEDDPDGLIGYSEFIGGYQQVGLFAKSDADIFYEDFKNFNGKKVGLSIGSNSEILDEYASEHGFSYTKVPIGSVKDKIKALNNGDVDLIAFSTLNTVPGGKLVAVLKQVPFYVCTAPNRPELLKELNLGISIAMVNTPDIVSETFGNVLKGYNIVSYTRAESEKIKSAEKVVFGVYSDAFPLASVDKNGKTIGIYVDILNRISEISGLSIEILPVETTSVNRELYSYLDDKTVDLVIGARELRYESANSENHIRCNDLTPFKTVPVALAKFTFDDNSPTIALTSARKYLTKNIYNQFPDAKVVYYDSRIECLNAVENNDVDATYLTTWELNYMSKNERYDNLKAWDNLAIESAVVLGGTRQSDPEILSILEKTISQLSQVEIDTLVTSNLNQPYMEYSIYDKIYSLKETFYIIASVLSILIVAFGIYFKVRRKYIKDLIVANNTKSYFLSRMSHELRTPLNAIVGYNALTKQALEENKLEKDRILENCKSVDKASDYLLGIIKDILDVQAMETGKLSLTRTEINPKEYMKIVVDLIQPMANEKKINFKYTMISGENYNYLLDAIRTQQILFNLLYNAIKFTPENGDVTLTSELLEKDEKIAVLQFVVSDTGIGMSKEFMENSMYHRFAQENQNITSPYSGCGNGLSIVKELVELMGGKIECTSEQGKGTTFTVTIKAAWKELKNFKNKNSVFEIKYDLSGTKVLVCEDNIMNQEIEKRILQKMNCEVEIADNGKIGLEKFSESELGYYNIILMDIRMPEMDGLEATRQIRALNRADSKTVPIVAISANAFKEDVQKSLNAGMNEHLAKPVDIRVLDETINKYCKK